MSLPSLRQRIEILKRKKGEDERGDQNVDTEELSTPGICRSSGLLNNTAELKPTISPEMPCPSPPDMDTETIYDHPTWLANIKANGNKPEDWLQYTNYVRDQVSFPDKETRNEYLGSMYSKGLKLISPDDYKRNSAYAHFFINFAFFRRDTDDPDEARSVMTMARINSKYFSIVHIVAAQLDLDDGRRDKSRKILEKVQEGEVYPKELLQKALKHLNNGAPVLYSQEDLEKYEEMAQTSQLTRKTSPFNRITEQQIINSEALLNSNSISRKQAMLCNTEELLQPKKSWTGNISLGNTTISELLKPKASDTRRNNGFSEKSQKTSEVSKKKDHNEMVVNPEYDSDVNTCGHPFFKAPSLVAPRAHQLSTPSAPHRPGEISLSTTLENTVTFKTENRMRSHSGSTSDENDTIPFVNERKRGNGNKVMKSYHSTPDCKSASLLSSETKKFSGLPRRIKRSSLLQLNQCDLKFDDTDNIHMEPLPEIDSLVEEHEINERKKSTNSQDSGVLTSTQSMDYAILESSDEHKPMDTTPASSHNHRTDPDVDSNLSGLQNLEKLHQNVSYIRNKGSGNKRNSSSNGQKMFENQSSQDIDDHHQKEHLTCENTAPSKENHAASNISMFQERPRPHQEILATPCQKRTEQEQARSLLAPTPGYHVPLKGPMVTPMGKQLEVLTINGKFYSVLKTIGRGGSSKVYEVLDESSNLRALKVVNMEDADTETIASYRNEIDLLKRLQYSDRIIKMYDFEYQEDKKKLYVVMEKGDTDLAALFKSRNKNGNITEGMRKFYWEEMLRAVHVLQQEGIVHSDLKPPNFLLVAGHLKLIDFGIAKAIQPDHTSAIRDQQVGTLNYISPEAVNDLSGGTQTDENGRVRPTIKIGVKSDVWSLGCILYNMVYARTPLQKFQNQVHKLHALLNPKFVIDFPDIPDKHLLDVLKKCLKWDPKDRLSIDELLNHPYITGKSQDVSGPAISGLNEENKQRLLKKMAVSSPRTVSAVFEGFLEQLQSGSEIDVNTMLNRKTLHSSPCLKSSTSQVSKLENNKGNVGVRMVPRAPFQPHNS